MRVLTADERETVYPDIYERVFGTKPEGHLPRTVIVQESEDEITGFISGYRIDNKTFYIAWGGSVNKFVGSRHLWKEGEAILKESRIEWVVTNVENTNTVWQRMLMGVGWIPHGMKVTQGKIFIEYYKEL